MKSKKGESGITLLVLVITVIVLLILSGVTVRMIAGKNGIINNTLKSVDESSHSQVKEKIKTELIEYEDSEGSDTALQFLGKKGLLKRI